MTSTKGRWVISLISIEQISGEISALEEEKLALSKVPDDDDNEEKRDAMDEIISSLEDALSSLEEALEILEGADF